MNTTAQAWKAKWAEAHARGPEAVSALYAERRFAEELKVVRQVEQARALRARLRSCEACGAPIPSLKRRRCPPCKGGRRG